MAIQQQATTPADLDDVAALMCAAFSAGPGAAFADRRLLRWKYFAPVPQWDGPRSYSLRQDNELLAHCAFIPFALQLSGAAGEGAARAVSHIGFIDWVASEKIPGAGVLLMKKLMKLGETAIIAGGTEMTRRTIPRLGFVQVGEVAYFARVVRPWTQFRTRPSEGVFRDAARLARNTAWSQSPALPISREWSATRVEQFAAISESRHIQWTTPARSPEYLNYWLRCPAAKISGFVIRQGREPRGHFLLSKVRGQTRIADIRIDSADPLEWQAAYRLAASTAAEDPETCETLGVASTPPARAALTACGFRQRGNLPLFLSDPQGKLSAAPIFWNLIDDDAAYTNDPAYPYST
ncbi:MAG: hypothetical protein M3407_00070 [Acidobacteriota bacterium]|nr:hypothetical protein [Acidobacteriota bacterium]